MGTLGEKVHHAALISHLLWLTHWCLFLFLGNAEEYLIHFDYAGGITTTEIN